MAKKFVFKGENVCKIRLVSSVAQVYPARLSQPPNRIYAGDGEFHENRSLWLQPFDFWTVIYYHHANIVTINARTVPVTEDSIVIFGPGVRAGHTLIGERTPHMYMTFNLPAETGRRYAIPSIVQDAKPYFAQMRRTIDRVSSDIVPAFSFAWQLLHDVSLDPAYLRQHEALYSAEEFILRHLKEPLSVPNIAEHAKVSPRQLLRMFRDEHHLTVRDFIRKKRTQEACRLLATTNRPIKLIAEQVGVADLAQFNKLLKQETGASPRVFRQMRTKS